MKYRLKWIAVILIAAMLLPACGKKDNAPELLVPVENPDAVFRARRMKLDTIYLREGSVCPDVYDMKFDFDSSVYDVRVKVGDYVQEGDTLFFLDEELEVRMKETEVDLTLRKKNYEVALKDHQNQVSNLKNMKNMFANMQDWYDYYLWDINLRENEANFKRQYEAEEKAIQELEEDFEEMKSQFESCEIKAPVSGQIVYLSTVKDGDSFEEEKTVVSIARQDKKLLCCELIEEKEYKAYSNIRAMINGVEYPITYLPYDEEELYNKKLECKNLYSYFEAEGLPDDVKFGDYVVFFLTIESNGDVLAVPSQAVTDVGGQKCVKVVSGDKQGLRPVTLGFSNKNYTEIKSGLNEGETVFVANNLARYGQSYETERVSVGSFTSEGYTVTSRKSLNSEPFMNPVPGEIKEFFVPTFSQVYVKEGQKLYTVTPEFSEADREDAKSKLKMAQDTYAKRLRDDKEALEKQRKNLNNMSKSVQKELAQLKYDNALKAYDQYIIDGQEYIDECQERVDAFEKWAEGDCTVYAEKDGFFSSFSKYAVGTEVKADEYVCDFYPLETLCYVGNDQKHEVRYGMEVNLEFRINNEMVLRPAKVVSAYDVRPEEAADADYFVVQIDDGDYVNVESDGHVVFDYCHVENSMTISSDLIKRDKTVEGGEEEETDELEQPNEPVTIIGNKLSDEEKENGVPYVWVFDENGQVVRRYITVVQEEHGIAWVCDGLSRDDIIVIH